MKFASILMMILLQSIEGCSPGMDLSTSMRPESFKLIIPFEISNHGIFIETYWGAGKASVKLLWDNHSPTWANDRVVNNNTSVSKSKNYFYSTTTADGSKIKGAVYRCDSISLGPVSFADVPFYKISDKMEGAFGENLISQGVWK